MPWFEFFFSELSSDMSIVTKTGDRGQTSLWSGERVDKDDLRVEAYGTIDELNAHLGVARHLVLSETLAHLDGIQNLLFNVAGALASRDKTFVHPVREEDLAAMERIIGEFEMRLQLKGFVIPGMTPASAQLDVARTVARRAERRIIALAHREEVPFLARQYVNRLADFLFILARNEEFQAGVLTYKTW